MRKKILFVGSEAAPFAATGGLGDVLGSLPAAIADAAQDGVDVRVILPLYASVSDKYRAEMREECVMRIPLAWRSLYCGVKSLYRDGVKWYFIDNEDYFKREKLYGYYDDGERFAFFCTAVMETMQRLNIFPDYLHANDWQAALTVIYAKRRYAHIPACAAMKTVFTIHNIEYQGVYDPAILGDIFALSGDDALTVMQGGAINLMKGAIECCDLLTTVSRRYAEEIKTPEFAHGLDEVIRRNSGKLSGILNGIDYLAYDPKTDPAIPVRYSSRLPDKKAENKTAFFREMGFDGGEEKPLFAMITRLASHKGVDLVCEIADRLLERDVRFAVLGTGDPGYESFFRELEARHRDKARSLILFDRALSRRLYAASDFFIMPSKSEPCGLSQMIASRYGSIPITRETGGLADSISDYGEEDGKLTGNGFTFRDYSGEKLLDRIDAALRLYRDREKYLRYVTRVMRIDFSWSKSAKKYLELYGV